MVRKDIFVAHWLNQRWYSHGGVKVKPGRRQKLRRGALQVRNSMMLPRGHVESYQYKRNVFWRCSVYPV